MRSNLLSLALLTAFATLACDSPDATSTTAPFQSSQPDDKVVSAMTPAEQEAFCQEIAVYFTSQVSDASMKKLMCYVLASAFSGGNADACNQSAQQCINDPGDSTGSSTYECDTAKVTDCSATVAEMETCYTALTAATKTLASRASCSLSASDLQGLEQKPAACQTVETKCPHLFEDTTDTGAPQ